MHALEIFRVFPFAVMVISFMHAGFIANSFNKLGNVENRFIMAIAVTELIPGI